MISSVPTSFNKKMIRRLIPEFGGEPAPIEIRVVSCELTFNRGAGSRGDGISSGAGHVNMFRRRPGHGMRETAASIGRISDGWYQTSDGSEARLDSHVEGTGPVETGGSGMANVRFQTQGCDTNTLLATTHVRQIDELP